MFTIPTGLANSHEYFQIVVDFFGYWWYSLLYVVAVLFLGYHLNHGFQSAFQTFGWNHKKYTPLIKKAWNYLCNNYGYWICFNADLLLLFLRR